MKCLQLKVEIEEDVQEPLVTIHCKEKNAFIEQLIAAIQMVDQKLLVNHNNSLTFVPVGEILYIESVDRKCFVYSVHEVYESSCKLYELTQQLSLCSFTQISKSCLVNLTNVESIKTYIDRRLLITMQGGEQFCLHYSAALSFFHRYFPQGTLCGAAHDSHGSIRDSSDRIFGLSVRMVSGQ